MLGCSPWALLPPVYSVCTAAGLWARRNGSFYAPYIIAGNFPPASCIFSEVMNLAAIVFIIAVLRYLQLKQAIDKPWLNFASLVAFSIGCFGMTLVGNFQEMIHNLGTFMTFGLGTLFCWVQSYITLRVNLRNEGRKAGIIRFLLSGAITLCMILFSLMAQRLHMHAARCQWALVMFFLTFLATFAIEFRHNRFDVVCTDNTGRPVSLSETHSQVCRYQADQL
uniref:Transmembrane protein 150C n=1 Tax=Seriola dumerili TaxID=41447 RepID=A0A3B4VQ28_SERDU